VSVTEGLNYLDVVIAKFILALIKKVVDSSDLFLADCSWNSKKFELIHPKAQSDALIRIFEFMIFAA